MHTAPEKIVAAVEELIHYGVTPMRWSNIPKNPARDAIAHSNNKSFPVVVRASISA